MVLYVLGVVEYTSRMSLYIEVIAVWTNTL